MTDQETKQGNAAEGQGEAQEFSIQKIFIKDVSFESPSAPAVFRSEWKPETSIQLNTEVTPLENDHHEVVLSVTVTTKSADKVAYLVEVKQAGIFLVKGFPEEQMGQLLGSFCPNTLFPYIREAISNLVTKGGFPEMLLAPINFDALYAQHLQQLQEQKEQSTPAAH